MNSRLGKKKKKDGCWMNSRLGKKTKKQKNKKTKKKTKKISPPLVHRLRDSQLRFHLLGESEQNSRQLLYHMTDVTGFLSYRWNSVEISERN